MIYDNFDNKLFNSDVIEVLRAIPDNYFDMIYGDPDYNVGINYAGKNFTKKWDEYIEWYIQLARESLRVLKPDGNLFFVNYPKQNSHLRVKYLDGNAYNVFDYVWVYNTNVGHSPRRFTTAHRSILHAVKSKQNRFYKSQVAEPYMNPNDKRIRQRIADGHIGRMPYSWMYHDLVKNVSKEKTSHVCQIPENLFLKLMKASTQENDRVMVLFGGSGSEIGVCKRENRTFTSCEIHPSYYALINDRFLSS